MIKRGESRNVEGSGADYLPEGAELIAVQPDTEEPRDLAYLQHLGVQPAAATPSLATPSAAAAGPATYQPADQPAAVPALERRDPAAEVPRAGVNSMFGL